MEWRRLEDSVFEFSQIQSTRSGEKSERALNAHSAILNKLADYLITIGEEPRSPKPSEPQFDLAWETDTELFVVEAKSLTIENEEDQLRAALGQIKRYSWHLRQEYTNKAIREVILVENQPLQENWLKTLLDNAIELVWPEKLAGGYLKKWFDC